MASRTRARRRLRTYWPERTTFSHSMGLACLSMATLRPSASELAAAEDPGNLAGLPVDDAGDDECHAATAVHLLPQLAGVDAGTAAIEDISGERMHLLDLEQPATDPSSQLGLGHVVEDELGLQDPAQVAVRPVEAILGAAAREPTHSHGGRRVSALERGVEASHLVPLLGEVAFNTAAASSAWQRSVKGR